MSMSQSDDADSGKWEWGFAEFLNAEEILNKYGISTKDLPKSSSKMPTFSKQLKEKLVINEKLIDNTDWFEVDQIKSGNRKLKKSTPNVVYNCNKRGKIKIATLNE